jgi:uncharacterized protein with ATP-grasp and redox domains
LRSYLDCNLCLLRQTLSAAHRLDLDEQSQTRLVRRTLAALQGLDPDLPPAVMATHIHRLIRQETSRADPYQQLKEDSRRQALAVLPELRKALADSHDPLATAVRLAIAGNIIDFVAADRFDLRQSIERALTEPLSVDHTLELREAVASSPWLLYLSDNAAEAVFDVLLIQQLGVPVRYAVRSHPAADDATEADALAAGVDRVARIVANGSDAIGTQLNLCSRQFRELFQAAPLIISKGQANYELLSGRPERLFFLLQAKCEVVARHMGIPQRSLIVKEGDVSSEAEGT